MIRLFAGLLQLARLAFMSKLRFRGSYWKWRLHTAFGRGYPASRMALVRSLVEYGCWMHDMRRMR